MSAQQLAESAEACDFLARLHSEGKPVGAIAEAMLPLHAAGLPAPSAEGEDG